MSDRLRVVLEKKMDNNGSPYYVGKLKAPVTISCNEGVAFLLFVSEENNEELQICSITKPKQKNQERNDEVNE